MLDASKEDGTMLHPHGPGTEIGHSGNPQVRFRKKNGISSVQGTFGKVPWTITYFNGAKNYVIPTITAKGAAIVMIPRTNAFASSEDERGMISNPITLSAGYDEAIKKPLLDSDGVLGQMIRDWEQDGQQNKHDQWFPDAIRIISTYPFDARQTKKIRYQGAYYRFRDDLYELWHKDTDGRKIKTILDDPIQPENPTCTETRFQEKRFNDEVGASETWSERYPQARHGYAISWTPNADGSSGKYEVWLGDEDRNNPWVVESLKRQEWGNKIPDEKIPLSHNWGYYPNGVFPDGDPFASGPGAGCVYYPTKAFLETHVAF